VGVGVAAGMVSGDGGGGGVCVGGGGGEGAAASWEASLIYHAMYLAYPCCSIYS
jgi:hypothetical protein